MTAHSIHSMQIEIGGGVGGAAGFGGNVDRVAAYDRAEQSAMLRLSNRAIEACSAAAFAHTGYPTRVSSEAELWRYADVMQDGRAKASFDQLGGLTEHEFKLLQNATVEAADATAKHCAKRIVPKDAAMRALLAYREIDAFYPGARVFELGPGSGYLGAMLDFDGHDYRSTDITQAFHLWQGMLVSDRQMPWWDWMDIDRPDFPVDVITVNHALNEMQPRALQYLIVRAERMLGTKGAMFVESWGAEYHRTTAQTASLFDKRGWHASTQGACHVLTPPTFDTVPEKAPLAERTKTWADVEAMWRELGAEECTPDDAFMKFCGS
jgi:hypothetical protein